MTEPADRSRGDDAQESWRECLECFEDRDYEECISKLAAYGMALGYRRWPVILKMGENALLCSQIYLICQLRLGQRFEAKGTMMLLGIGLDDKYKKDQWWWEILQLTYGEATLENVLRVARDERERILTKHYCAERLVTERKFEAAIPLFSEVIESSLESEEKRVALARIEWLQRQERA